MKVHWVDGVYLKRSEAVLLSEGKDYNSDWDLCYGRTIGRAPIFYIWIEHEAPDGFVHGYRLDQEASFKRMWDFFTRLGSNSSYYDERVKSGALRFIDSFYPVLEENEEGREQIRNTVGCALEIACNLVQHVDAKMLVLKHMDKMYKLYRKDKTIMKHITEGGKIV